MVGLLGTGVGASFFDQVTGTENINVGSYDCQVTAATGGSFDANSATYNAPAIVSSAPGNAPFQFDVKNVGSIPMALSVSGPTWGGTLDGSFSGMPATLSSATLAPGATSTVSTGIQWTALDNADLGDSGSATWTVACNENSVVVVHASNLATSFADVGANPTKWLFYNDYNDTIDNTDSTMVAGPGTPPAGTGSAQISVSGTTVNSRRNIATYQFSGTPLANITVLRFSTYNPSAGNPGSSSRSGYLHFNVDFNLSDTWQSRLVFVPSQNGTVNQDTWQEWDAINGGSALWSYSGATWPVCAGGGAGTTLKTWSSIISGCPSIRIRVTDAFLGIRVGEPYADGYTENIDAVKFGTASVLTFDFEP